MALAAALIYLCISKGQNVLLSFFIISAPPPFNRRKEKRY